jgi:hypothetical protein
MKAKLRQECLGQSSPLYVYYFNNETIFTLSVYPPATNSTL